MILKIPGFVSTTEGDQAVTFELDPHSYSSDGDGNIEMEVGDVTIRFRDPLYKATPTGSAAPK